MGSSQRLSKVKYSAPNGMLLPIRYRFELNGILGLAPGMLDEGVREVLDIVIDTSLPALPAARPVPVMDQLKE